MDQTASLISSQELATHLQSNQKSFFLIDVRTPAEFAESHIKNSLSFPLESFSKDRVLEKFSKNEQLILVCRTGKRAKAAQKKFSDTGFTNTKVLIGGIDKWLDIGKEVVHAPIKTISLERQVRITAGTLILAGSLLTYLSSPTWFILPALIGAGLIFAGITDSCGMAMLLARMPWNQHNANYLK